VQDPKDKITFFGKDVIWFEVYRTNMSIGRVAKIPQKEFLTLLEGRK